MGLDNWLNRGQSDSQTDQSVQPTPAENQAEVKNVVETNLYNALRELEPQILALGIYKVGAETIATAKGALEGLEISIKGTINSIDLIGVEFWYRDGRRETKSIVGWQEEKQYLSGAASVETFKERIKKELGIVDKPTVETERAGRDWSSYIETQGKKLAWEELMSREYLLVEEPQLSLKKSDAGGGAYRAAYDVYPLAEPTAIVVRLILDTRQVLDQDGKVNPSKAEKIKARLMLAIDKAFDDKVPQTLDLDHEFEVSD